MNALFQWVQHGQVRQLDPEHGTTANGPCIHSNAVFLAGTGVTDGMGGQWELVLDPATMCLPLEGADWVSLVATPSHREGTGPIGGPPPVITAEWTTISTGLILRVRTRDGHGQKMTDIPFAWHAVILRQLG